MAINANVVARCECDICSTSSKEEVFDVDGFDEDDVSIPAGWIYKEVKKVKEFQLESILRGYGFKVNDKVLICPECIKEAAEKAKAEAEKAKMEYLKSIGCLARYLDNQTNDLFSII